jgi:putative ATP-dependent endonuclease of OLD family
MSVLTLESISVKNFKSIKSSEEVRLDDLNILVGKNDAGKSSLLQALDIFLRCRKPSNGQFHKHRNETMEIEVVCTDIPETLSQMLSDEYSDPPKVQVKRVFEKRSDTTPGASTLVNGEELSKGAVVENGEGLTKAQSRNRVWDFMPEPILIEAERDVTEETKLKSGTLLNQLLVPILEQGGIGERGSLGDQKQQLEETLGEVSQKISRELTHSLQQHLPDLEHIRIDTGGVDLERAISPDVVLEDRYLDDSVEISERGSGVGSLFILSLMQEFVDRQVGEGYCLLYEEPGNWLHPSAERKMLDALKKISEEGGQVLITTHSEVFIDRKETGRLYIVRRDNGKSNFSEIEQDAFRAVEEIGARNSDLLQSDFVLYVEGPTDAKVVREICRNAIDDWKEHNAVVQHLGGTGNLRHCDPSDLKKINRNCAFLLDSDKNSLADEPNDVAQELNKKADTANIPCLILDKREIENYFTAAGINQAISNLDIDTDSTPDYESVPKWVEKKIIAEVPGRDPPEQVNKLGNYDKVNHGQEIVRNMYEEGDRIPEIENFVKRSLDN